MTLNILLFSITIKKRLINENEARNDQIMNKVEEDNRNRLVSIPRNY
jgi:uncharacterized protein (TIGR02413 family)